MGEHGHCGRKRDINVWFATTSHIQLFGAKITLGVYVQHAAIALLMNAQSMMLMYPRLATLGKHDSLVRDIDNTAYGPDH